jgi:DNA-binding beta-propeller fold protein YncE
MPRIPFLKVLTSILLVSCGAPAVKTALVLPDKGAPAALVKEREISGTILGQSLRQPAGVASDAAGNVYLVDAGNNRVIKFDSSFKALADRGGFGNQQGQFNQPKYITVDNILALLVSDAGNRRIERLDAELNYVDQYVLTDDTDPLKYGAPSGVAATKYGAVWIVDKDKNHLIILDNVGQFDRFAADYGATGGELERGEKLISDADDNFYVCDPGNARIAVYNTNGTFVRSIKDDRLMYPIAAAFDEQKFLWVLDQANLRLFLFSPDGHKITEQGLEIFGLSSPLTLPADLAVLPNGRLLISDGGDNRLVICRIIYTPPQH